MPYCYIKEEQTDRNLNKMTLTNNTLCLGKGGSVDSNLSSSSFSYLHFITFLKFQVLKFCGMFWVFLKQSSFRKPTEKKRKNTWDTLTICAHSSTLGKKAPKQCHVLSFWPLPASVFFIVRFENTFNIINVFVGNSISPKNQVK